MKNLKGNLPNLYYSYKNIIYSKTAQANEIDNIPGSDRVWGKEDLSSDNIKLSLHRLFKYCINPITTAFGRYNVALTSVYRNKEVNKILGGVENSQHIFGYAADIVLTNNEPSSKLFNWCRFNLPEYHQLIWEYPERGDYKGSNEDSSWVHISYIEGNFPRTSSVSSKREDIHEMYKGEKTLRKGNYTHNITIAEQSIIDSNYEPLRNVSQLRSFQPPDENNG